MIIDRHLKFLASDRFTVICIMNLFFFVNHRYKVPHETFICFSSQSQIESYLKSIKYTTVAAFGIQELLNMEEKGLFCGRNGDEL